MFVFVLKAVQKSDSAGTYHIVLVRHTMANLSNKCRCDWGQAFPIYIFCVCSCIKIFFMFRFIFFQKILSLTTQKLWLRPSISHYFLMVHLDSRNTLTSSLASNICQAKMIQCFLLVSMTILCIMLNIFFAAFINQKKRVDICIYMTVWGLIIRL